jgi:subtilisin family serine protease
VTVQLTEPALLATTRQSSTDGISQAARDRLAQEQAGFLQRVRHISEDIEVVYQYRLVLNGFTLAVPVKYRERFAEMAETSSLGAFEPKPIPRAPVQQEDTLERPTWGEVTSVSFINALQVHEELGMAGEGIKVGVIDTGIDYTHAMFNGAGDPAVYEANDPAVVDQPFPTEKVAGGRDFVGTAYDSGASDWRDRLPRPDPDPLDESAHGTHVAGTIAGIGDGQQTYNGVAPEAQLYALKVFGRSGSTTDAVVIAALEYAADPNQDLQPDDRLDVVNLSLGGGFGVPNTLYDLAIENLAQGGTIAVISAGNSGDVPYIVGSPSTTAASISVAASVDGMDQNWRQRASAVIFADGERQLVPMVAGGITPDPTGFAMKQMLMHYVGLANADLSAEDKAALDGKLALIDRGEVTFCEKGQRVQQVGAVGFVVVNQEEGPAIRMGGDCELSIPGVMITLEVGDRLKDELIRGDQPRFSLDAGEWLESPEKIDKLTGFSSRGPRSIDGLFKPEITAPGQSIISAGVGTGDDGMAMSGTSMAAPHIAGVVALLKQQNNAMTLAEVKSRLMGTSVTLLEDEEQRYPLTRQGAGRVDAYAAMTSELIVQPAALSLGHVLVDQAKTVLKKLVFTNQSDQEMDLAWQPELDEELVWLKNGSVRLAPGETRLVSLPLQIKADIYDQAMRELDGFIKLIDRNRDAKLVAKLPVLAVLKRVAQVKVDSFQVYSSSAADAAESLASLKLINDSETRAQVLPFIPIGRSERNTGIVINPTRNNLCDLASAGYRVRESWSAHGAQTWLELGIKLYQPVTTWNLCSVLIGLDLDLDGQIDRELLNGQWQDDDADQGEGDDQDSWSPAYRLSSVNLREAADADDEADEGPARFETFDYSSLAVTRIPWGELPIRGQREIGVEITVYARTGSPDGVDQLLPPSGQSIWRLPVRQQDLAWSALPDRVTVRPGDYQWLDLSRGYGDDELLLLIPENASSESQYQTDEQSLWVTPAYGL